MCPWSRSTAMPSGSRQSVTVTLRLEPSGFTVTMRLPLASSTNRRPSTVLAPGGRLDLAAFDSDILVLLFIVHRRKRGRDQTQSADALSAQGNSSHSVRNRYRARSATVTITRLCALQNR